MAFKRFSISGNAGAASATAATAGIMKLEGTAATRAALYEWDFGSAAGAAPVDQNYQLRLKRQSTAGTWTSQTPVALDSADPAAVAIGAIASTAAGTTGSVLMVIGVNARAGFRWVAIPDSELIVPATASNGIILEYAAVSGGTDINAATFLYQE
jgi:hypothetical protein